MRFVAKPITVNGIRYRSHFEAAVAARLAEVLPLGVPVRYEGEQLTYTTHRLYVPDFTIERPRVWVRLEAKGALRVEDRMKLLAVRAAERGIDLRLVFQNANARAVGMNATCAEWARRNGFPYVNGVENVTAAWVMEEPT